MGIGGRVRLPDEYRMLRIGDIGDHGAFGSLVRMQRFTGSKKHGRRPTRAKSQRTLNACHAAMSAFNSPIASWEMSRMEVCLALSPKPATLPSEKFLCKHQQDGAKVKNLPTNLL